MAKKKIKIRWSGVKEVKMAKEKAFAIERWCADGIWRVLKVYPFRAQCIIWCYMHKLMYRYRHHHFLDDTIRIREI